MTFQRQFGAGLREASGCPFRTAEYEPQAVVVKCDKVEIESYRWDKNQPDRPFGRLLIDGREVDWKSVSLSRTLPGPWRLVVEVPVR